MIKKLNTPITTPDICNWCGLKYDAYHISEDYAFACTPCVLLQYSSAYCNHCNKTTAFAQSGMIKDEGAYFCLICNNPHYQ